jgi:hypothetical protein
MTTSVSAGIGARLIQTLVLTCFAATVFLGLAVVPAPAQTVSTWSGGAGNWSDCPPSGNALWNTCPDPPNGLGWPNGNFDAVINGGPVTATSASIVNLTIGSGGSLAFAAGQPGILDITGTSMVNNGSISLAGVDGLQIEGNTTVTLSGSGSVTMAGNNFTGGNGQPTLILQQPVQGQGTFSLGLNLTNQNVINANGGTLFIQPISAINTGTMEASSGSILAFTNGVPTAYNNAGGVIKALDGGTVQLDNGVYTGGTLATAGTGVIQVNNVAVLNGLTNSGTLLINDAALENTINNTGVIQVPSATLAMSGSVALSGTGSLMLSGSGNLHQLNSTNDTLTNNQLIHGAGTIFELPLTNSSTGTISADSAGNTLTLAGSTTSNTGLLEATGGGTLQLNSVIKNTGGKIEALGGSTVIFTNASNGSISGGTLTTSGTGTIQSQNGVLDGTVNVPTNAGKLTVHNFDLFFQGTINNTGTIALSGNSCVIMNQPSTLTGTGKLTMTSTTCIFGLGLSFTNASNIQGSGSIGDSNPMPITNQGTIFANQSSPMIIHPDTSGFTNTGKLMVNPGSTINITGLFNNLNGSGTLSGGTYMVSGILDFPNPVVTNAANITLTGPAAEIFSSSTAANALSTLAANAGVGVLSLQKGQALTTVTNLSNAGKLTVGSTSSLSVGGSYTQTAGTTTVDGTLTAPAGLTLQKGSLVGRGTLAAAVTSSAIVTAGDSTTKPGKLSPSAYTQNATGSLNVAIGGITVGTLYSQLAVANGASLNGTLNIKLINGFVPAIGSTFTILTGTAVTGTFSTVKGLSINSGEHFTISYNPTNVTLTAATGP